MDRKERFWAGSSGKARSGFSFVTALFFAGFAALVLVSEYFETPSSNQPSSSPYDSDRMPVAPDPTYVWGLASDADELLLNADTVSDDNIALILDFSGSMTENACDGGGQKASVALRALRTFLADVPEAVNLSLIAFDNAGFGVVVPMAKNNAAAIENALSSLVPGGGTPLGEAMEIAVEVLEKAAAERLGNGSYKIVVITDGAANDPQHVLHEVKWANLNTPIMTYTAGFCIGPGHPLNQPGETVYASAASAEGLLDILSSAVAEAQDFGGASFKEETSP